MAGSYSFRICSVLIAAIVLQSAEAARKKHASLLGKESGETLEGTMDSSGTVHIAGVAVYNYHLAPPAGKKGRWNVQFPDEETDSQLQEFCEEDGNDCERIGHPGKNGIAFATIICTKAQLKAILTAHPEIKMAEPDMKINIIPEVDDEDEEPPSLLEERSSVPWGLDRIDAEEGLDSTYDVPRSAGQGVHVYVVDTGVNINHEKFQGRASPGADCSRGACVECTVESYNDPNKSCGVDINGHGTHCAGTVGGADVGVAQGAHIHNVKMFFNNAAGNMVGYSSATIASLDWIASNGQRPTVASLSVGSKGFQQAANAAVERATKAGVTVVVAAGNSNDDGCQYSLSAYADSISVGSTTRSDKRSSFSNYGKCVNIFAPGSSVLSLSHRSNDGTTTKSGTSMACPHVAGAAAVLLEKNPTFSPLEVRQRLYDQSVCDKIEDPKGTPNKLLRVWTKPWTGVACATTTTTTRPAGWSGVIEGPCKFEDNCASSGNYPSNYGDKERCVMQLSGSVSSVVSFETEAKYDILEVGEGGTKYSGATGPDVGTDLTSKQIVWSADYSQNKAGWKICVGEPGATPAPTTPSTPAPTTPVPTTPAPTTPAPTTPAPTTPAPTTPAPTSPAPTPSPGQEECTNKRGRTCDHWKEAGYCNEGNDPDYRPFMLANCKKACGVCEGQTPAPTTPAPTTPSPTTPSPTEDASTQELKQILTDFDVDLAADQGLIDELTAWKNA